MPRSGIPVPPLDADALIEAVERMAAVPAPRGAEAERAEAVRDWAERRWPECEWRVLPTGAGGANLLARSHTDVDQPELLLYSHLDTSLSGDPARDAAVTGRSAPSPELRFDPRADTLSGFGLGVATAPAAAALLGFATAARQLRDHGRPHRLSLLLAGAGTHASGDGVEPGVVHYLRGHPPPAAAVVAKCGPSGVLHEEPGAMYLRVRVSTDHTAGLARAAAAPPGGLLVHTGTLVDAVEEWRDAVVRRGSAGQCGSEVALGALRAGATHKPDLLPGALDLHLYVVTSPLLNQRTLAGELCAHLHTALAGTALAQCQVAVTAEPLHPAAGTDPAAPVVALVRRLWEEEHGVPTPEITDWTGSTDGVVLRAAGVDTVRTGPGMAADPHDPRRERLSWSRLRGFARLYGRTALGFCSGTREEDR